VRFSDFPTSRKRGGTPMHDPFVRLLATRDPFPGWVKAPQKAGMKGVASHAKPPCAQKRTLGASAKVLRVSLIGIQRARGFHAFPPLQRRSPRAQKHKIVTTSVIQNNIKGTLQEPRKTIFAHAASRERARSAFARFHQDFDTNYLRPPLFLRGATGRASAASAYSP